jgi:8-amino-7-oxononanoate synthase
MYVASKKAPKDSQTLNVIEARLQAQLDRRKVKGSFRQLLPLSSSSSTANDDNTTALNVDAKRRVCDFSSNDYLGLARCKHQEFLVGQEFQRMQGAITDASADVNMYMPRLGATGSRLLSGDSWYARQLEQSLAHFHNRPCGILFNSGYDANLSVLSSIPLSSDFVLLDDLVHNSIIMGLRMGRCKQIFHFQHNSIKDLERILCHIDSVLTNNKVDKNYATKPHVFVVVESVYSMDGDISPLVEIASVLERFPDSSLIVDEAHGLGVYGRTNVADMMLLPDNPDVVVACDLPPNCEDGGCSDRASTQCGCDNKFPHHHHHQQQFYYYNGGGTGVLAALGLEQHPSLLCSVHTFGKGAGCHGAFVAASRPVVEYLVNYARPWIYSTSLPPHSLASIRCAYESMTSIGTGDDRRKRLFRNVYLFRSLWSRMSSKASNRTTANETMKPPFQLLPSPSPIQCILIPGNSQCINVARQLQKKGFDVYPIRSPTVPEGKERIRIILHAHNTTDEVVALVTNLVLQLVGPGMESSKLPDHHHLMSKL